MPAGMPAAPLRVSWVEEDTVAETCVAAVQFPACCSNASLNIGSLSALINAFAFIPFGVCHTRFWAIRTTHKELMDENTYYNDVMPHLSGPCPGACRNDVGTCRSITLTRNFHGSCGAAAKGPDCGLGLGRSWANGDRQPGWSRYLGHGG